MKSENFKNLCIKEITNNISDVEKNELSQLLKTSEEYRIEFEELKKTWNSAIPEKLEYNLDLDNEWDRLTEKSIMKPKNSNNNNFSEFLSGLFGSRFKPAFVVSSILVLIVATFFVINNDAEKILKTISTTNNETLEVELSDGSVVQLNNGSKIEFYENFEEAKREVQLTGEAFFSVANDGRSFIINTENAITKVLGTKFNVWARNNETRVVVKEGKVSLAENTVEEKEVFLTKGEASKVVANLLPEEPTKVNADKLLGWMDGKMVFENSSLNEITNELERYYDIKITLENLELSKYNLTGTFDNEEIDTVLTKICLALNIKYLEGRNSYKLTK